MSIAETVAEAVASFKIQAEAGVVARLSEHLTAADQLINPEWATDYEKLLLLAIGGTLYLRFIPPRFANATAPTPHIGYGAFSGRSHPTPRIYIFGAPYKLVVEGPFVALYYGKYLTWSGVGEQTGLDGTYELQFAHHP